MSHTLKKVISDYIKDSSKRRKSIVSDNCLLVDELEKRFNDESIQKIDKDIFLSFLCYLMEEEMRRYEISIDEDDDYKLFISKLLNIDLHKTVIDYVDDLAEKMLDEPLEKKDYETYFDNRMKINLKIVSENVGNVVNVNNLSIQAKKLFNIYKLAIFKYFLPYAEKLDFLCNEKIEFNSLESFGITTNKQFLTLIVQNRINKSDIKMNNSIKNNEYVDFLNDNEYLDHVAFKIIKEKRKNMVNDLTNIKTGIDDKIVIDIFKKTKNITTIAGILKGLNHNSILFNKLVKVLTEEKCESAIHKIKMLKRGSFLDTVLISDDNINVTEWIPTKEVLIGLIKNNMDTINRSVWVSEFPLHISIISSVYMNSNS